MISGAEQFYGDELAATLLAHLRNNYLFSSPDALVMGRAVNHTAALAVLRNPEWQFPREQQTAWWLQWAEGDWRSLVRHFPYPLPFIVYERRGRLRIRAWDSFGEGNMRHTPDGWRALP